MEERLIYLESQAEQLRSEVALLRTQFTEHQQLDSLKAENQLLRQAVLRYALACGDVDLKMAMARSRHESSPESLASLQQATNEEKEASRTLRELAQSLKLAEQERNHPPTSSGG